MVAEFAENAVFAASVMVVMNAVFKDKSMVRPSVRGLMSWILKDEMKVDGDQTPVGEENLKLEKWSTLFSPPFFKKIILILKPAPIIFKTKFFLRKPLFLVQLVPIDNIHMDNLDISDNIDIYFMDDIYVNLYQKKFVHPNAINIV